MKNRLFTGTLAFCISLTLLSATALAAHKEEQEPTAQFYGDISDIIGPIKPPTPENNENATDDTPLPLPDTSTFHSNEDFKAYDPGYPEKERYGNYVLRIPPLKDRLTFSTNDKKQLIGTLFAPGVSSKEGWKDATKVWGNRDSGLCFAASSSNLISWYLDQYTAQHPEDSYEYERNVEKIFDRFRDGWDPAVGGDQLEALSWYFTGGFPSGNSNPNGSELTHKEPGGYLRNHLPHNSSERWSEVSFDWKPRERFSVFGSFEDNRFPFIESIGGISSGGAFSNLKSFSQQILRQLHYGPCTISIIADNSSGGGGHAITLWGVDYDVKTGLVTRIHVTDSDDARSIGIFSVSIEESNHNDGVRLVNYPYHPPTGASTRFTRIRDSILLYAPEVVKSTQDYIGAQAQISALNPDEDGHGVTVLVTNIGNSLLEYGYSYDDNPDNIVQWQSDNYFSDLQPDQYYFFARVKETSTHAAGGTSAASPYRVTTPSPASSEVVSSLGLGNSLFHAYNQTPQYLWFGTERGFNNQGSEEPILWRVLDKAGTENKGNLFLISDKLYGTGKTGGLQFSSSGNGYQDSDARRWCKDFESSNLAPWEQSAIQTTTKTDAPYYAATPITQTKNALLGDRLFLPSAEEISNPTYGFDTAANRQARYHTGFSSYWLRSPDSNDSSKAWYVDGTGNIVSDAVTKNYAARPAFHLDGSQVLYGTAVRNGQFTDALGLQKIQSVQSQDFRLVLKDTSRDFRVTDNSITLQPGESVTLDYQGAIVNSSEYISVIVTDQEGTTPLYYGKLAPVQNADGQVRFPLPAELLDGTYVLKVFNEQYNGQRKSGKASPFVDVTLNIQTQSPVETVSDVHLTIPAPVTGQTPQNAQSNENGYTIEKTTWTPADDVFKANTSYSVSIVIKAKENYAIADHTVFTLNNEVISARKDGDNYIISYDAFPKTEDDNSGNSSNGETDNVTPPDPDGGTEGENGNDTKPDNGNEGENGNNTKPDNGNEGENGNDTKPDNGNEGESGNNTKPDNGNEGESGNNSKPDTGTESEGDHSTTPDSNGQSENEDITTPDNSSSQGSSQPPATGGNTSEFIIPPTVTPHSINSTPSVAKKPTEKTHKQEDFVDSKQKDTPTKIATKPSENISGSTHSDETTDRDATTKQDPIINASNSSKHGYWGWIVFGISVPVIGSILFFVLKTIKSKKR